MHNQDSQLISGQSYEVGQQINCIKSSKQSGNPWELDGRLASINQSLQSNWFMERKRYSSCLLTRHTSIEKPTTTKLTIERFSKMDIQ